MAANEPSAEYEVDPATDTGHEPSVCFCAAEKEQLRVDDSSFYDA